MSQQPQSQSHTVIHVSAEPDGEALSAAFALFVHPDTDDIVFSADPNDDSLGIEGRVEAGAVFNVHFRAGEGRRTVVRSFGDFFVTGPQEHRGCVRYILGECRGHARYVAGENSLVEFIDDPARCTERPGNFVIARTAIPATSTDEEVYS